MLSALVFFVSPAVHAHVSIENAWARPGIEGRNTAIYFDVVTDEPDLKLEKATCDKAKKTEIHTHINDQGVMRMRCVPFLTCTQGKTSLKRGGDHVMLMGLHKDLKEKDTLSLGLEFSGGRHVTVMVPVGAPDVKASSS